MREEMFKELFELFDMYKTHFIPIYDDLIILVENKADTISMQLENILSHILVCFDKSSDDKVIIDNIRKAKNHLIRATLDAYKICCHYIKLLLDSEAKFNDSKEYVKDYIEFLGKYRDARKTERDDVGINPIESIKKYKEAHEFGIKLIEKYSIPPLAPTVFISHKTNDDVAEKIKQLLELEGFKCLVAEDEPNIGELKEKIEKLIDESDGVIIIASRDEKLDGKDEWTTSNWIHQEIAYAKAKNKPIFIFYETGLSHKEKYGFQEGLEYLEFDREKLDEFLIDAIKCIRKFRKDIGKFLLNELDMRKGG